MLNGSGGGGQEDEPDSELPPADNDAGGENFEPSFNCLVQFGCGKSIKSNLRWPTKSRSNTSRRSNTSSSSCTSSELPPADNDAGGGNFNSSTS